MWLIVGQLPIKAGWRDATFALWNFSRSNKYLRNFSLNWQLGLFGPNLFPKGISSQKQNGELHHWTLHIRITLGTKFQLKLRIFYFLDQICPWRVFSVKNKTNVYNHWTLHIQIRLGIKFQIKLIIFIFWAKFAQKRAFPDKNEKSEHHHWILHIRISVRTKFQLKLIILAFWNKFAEKGHF